MKILVIGRSYPAVETGMFGTFEYDQALILQSTGHDVRYFFQDTRPIYRLQKFGYKTYQGDVPSSGVFIPVGHLPKKIFDYAKLETIKKYLVPILDSFQPDIVHIHYPAILLTKVVWDFLRSKCKRIVLTEHYTKVMKQTLPAWKLKELSEIYSQSDCVLCVSEALKKAVQKMCSHSNVFVVPNAVSSEIAPARQEKKQGSTFVYVGRLDAVKQVDVLLNAFYLFSKNYPSARLNIVGDGTKRNALKNQADRLHLTDRVRFYGNVTREEVGRILAKSDFFVTATRLETFCVPVIEAWYCGLPVIVPDSVPILNYMSPDNSIVFPDSNVRKLAVSMCQAVKTADRFDSEKIAAFADQQFGEASIGRMLTDVYSRVL